MSLHARLAALERHRPAAEDALDGMADSVLATLAAAEGTDPLPERAGVLEALRHGDSIACRGHVIRRVDDELLIREYVGVDPGLLCGRRLSG